MKELTILSRDGTQLYGRLEQAEDAVASVVIVHGLCEHQGRYDSVAEKLLAAGISVCRFDHRGHGRSGGTQTYYSSHMEMLEDIDAFVELARKEWPEQKLFILGHSLGGFGTAAYGTAYPGKATGYLLSGAATWDSTGSFASVPQFADPMQYRENGLAENISRDPRVVQSYKEDPLVARRVSFGLYQAIARGQQWMKANVGAFTDPVLLMHGAKDLLVSEADSRAFFGAIASQDKSLHMFNGLVLLVLIIAGWLINYAVNHYKYHDATLNTDLIGTARTKDGFMGVVKAAMLAGLTFLIGMLFLGLINEIFHVDFRLWLYTVKSINLEKLTTAFRYLPIFFVFYGINAWNVSNTKFKNKPEWFATLMLCVFNCLGLALIFTIQYVTFKTTGALWHSDMGTRYPTLLTIMPILCVATIYSKSLYKRTGNCWTAAFLTALLATFACVGGSSASVPYTFL